MPLEKIAELMAAAIPKDQSPKGKFIFNDVAASVVGCLIGGDYSANPEQAAFDARALLEELKQQGDGTGQTIELVQRLPSRAANSPL